MNNWISRNRKQILQVHKILGLVTGIVVFIVSITGCLWVFQEEIKDLTTEKMVIEPNDNPILTATQAKMIAQETIPDKSIHGVLYSVENDPIEVIFYEAEPEFYQSVFIHPYSYEVLRVEDHKSGFLAFVLEGHMRLWLPKAIGARLVQYSVLLFLIILISGLFLWWPKNKKVLKKRLKFDWKETTKWRRKNFDLHSVVGFYVGSLAFVLAFTGCVMAFDWFYYITYKTTGGSKDPRFVIPNNNVIDESKTYQVTLDDLVPRLKKEYPEAISFELHYPHSDTTCVYVETTYNQGIHYNVDYLFFDQNTLEEIETPSIYGKYQNAGFADSIIRMNYDIHVGEIGGIWGKIIAFLASLITATLPVSGTLLWYGKKKK
ncbi:PepSY domain-containing protein [bacterium SCSIO 12643]|nr:PepSY domain-containing protein [bacterium SCSIO 12643]